MAKKKHGGKRKGAGRPVSEEGPAEVIAASVPKSLADELRALAKANGWGISRAVAEAIRELLKRKCRA
jgi:hypothetical protein